MSTIQLTKKNSKKSKAHPNTAQQYLEHNQTLGDLNPNPYPAAQYVNQPYVPYPPQGVQGVQGMPFMPPPVAPYVPNSYPQQQQMNQGMQPVYQVDPYAPQQINQGIQQGFSQFFFNASDPNIAKTNVPTKIESSMHLAIIISTVILIAGIVAGVVIFASQPTIIMYGGIAIGVGYIIYAVVSITKSTIRGYITNLKKFDDYKLTYEKMVKGRGYFRFWIECYHYTTTRSRKGRSSRKKVVTHTASENFFPNMSIDESGNIEGIKDVTKYVFINYLKKFYFGDTRSQSILNNAYNNFIGRNRRDTYQNHTKTFNIEGFEPEVGFCMQGQSPHNSFIFYLLTMLGLALPYSCILERSVSRYNINILKKLTY